MTKFSNGLSDAEAERLALLIEEMGEALQIAGKIMRHGYESHNPVDPRGTNRRMLEVEIGHVLYAMELMQNRGDTVGERVTESMVEKQQKIGRWLHHQ